VPQGKGLTSISEVAGNTDRLPENAVGPWDSISNAGDDAPRGGASEAGGPSFVRLRARDGSTTSGGVKVRSSTPRTTAPSPASASVGLTSLYITCAGGALGGACVQVLRPPTLAELLATAQKKAHLLWPTQPHTTATGVVDDEDCEVDDDNYVLVQPGALLYVCGTDVSALNVPAAQAANPFM
jgi:hypothetical protein